MIPRIQATEASHAMNDNRFDRWHATSTRFGALWPAAGLVLATLLGGATAEARRTAQDAGDLDRDPLPAAVSELRLDFDSRPGTTVIGITSSTPLQSHTIYESDGTTTVVEIPDADVSAIPEVAQVATSEVERIVAEAGGASARGAHARLTIIRSRGTRRESAIDPRNPRRLEISIITTEPVATPAPDAAPAREKVLAAAVPPAPKPEAPKPRTQESVAKTASSAARAGVEPAAKPAPKAAAAAPAPQAAPPVATPPAAASDAESVARLASYERLTTPSYAGGAFPSRVESDAGSESFAARDEDPGPARLMDVTVESSADGRVAIRLAGSKRLDVSPFVLDDPPRLALDVRGAVNAVSRATVPVRQGGVQQVRVAQNRPLPDPVVRIVVDLDASSSHEVVPGPTSTLVLVGEPGRRAPALASVDATQEAEWQESLGAPDATPRTAAALVQKPQAPASLGDLGRPATFGGAAPTPLRETAGSTLLPMSTSEQETGRKRFSFETQAISPEEDAYSGDPISMHYKDADLQDLFRMFKIISGLNIVVDPSIKGKTITLELDEVPWDQALAMVLRTHNLGSSLEGNILRIAPLTKLAQDEAQKQSLKDARDNAGDLFTVARRLSYASANAAQAIVRKILSPRGDVTLDRGTNTLLVRDIKARLEDADRILDLLDQPIPQVMIEARIVETTKDFSKAIGINWGFTYIADRAFGNSTNFSFPRGGSADYAVNLPVQASNNVLGLSFRNILDTFAIDLAISSLEERGRARIVSSPRIMVQNNERAEIESGVQIPISTTTATEINVTFVSASLRLEVTPQITADGVVIMNVSVDNNQPVFLSGASDQASISTRQARTTVAVPDGGTTIIGGIYQVNEGTTQGRVPFLSRIPLLGWLFRNKTIDRTNDELLIFLTPHIQKA